MPAIGANLTALRADGHTVELYLGAWLGSLVLTGTVSATPISPTLTLAYTTVSGSHTDVKRGYRVVIETSGGAYKGETSVRFTSTITATSLPIRELSSGELRIVSGDVLKVYSVPVLGDKLVADDATFAPDELAYVAQNGTVPPIACSGGPWMGFADNGQTYATVLTQGSASYTVDEDSSGAMTHLWTLPASVAFAPGSSATDVSPTLRANVGESLVEHFAIDSSNSVSWLQYVLIKVYDAANPPLEISEITLDADAERGWSAAVTTLDSVPQSVLPDGAMTCVFARETNAGAVRSFGAAAPGRGHMKVVGYIRSDSVDYRGYSNGTTFTLQSPLARLAEVCGFSKVMEIAGSPANWSQVEGLTVRRAIILIARYYTWLTEIYDLVFDSFTDYSYPAFYLQKNTPVDQMRELADATDARLTCDRTGRFMLQTRQVLVPLASRAALTTTITLTDDDMEELVFEREHWRKLERYQARGYTASTSTPTPIFSVWPGTPARGRGAEVAERLIAASQSNLNDRCGLRAAAIEGVYVDSSDVQRLAIRGTLELPGAYDIFDPAYQEWVQFDAAAAPGLPRGVVLSSYRFMAESVSLTYEEGTARTTVQLQSETAARPGVVDTSVIPDSAYADIANPDLAPVPEPQLIIPDLPPGSRQPPANIFAVGVDEVSSQTVIVYGSITDFDAGTVTWSANLNDGTVTGTGQWACGDPRNPKRKFVLTSTGVYKTEDITAGSPTWALVANNNTMFGDAARVGGCIHATIHRAGCFIVTCGTNMIARTDNYGTTWTRVRVWGGADSYGTSPDDAISIAFAEASAGVVLAGWTDPGDQDVKLSLSSNYGVSWTEITGTAVVGNMQDGNIYVPYKRVNGALNKAGPGTTGTVVYINNIYTYSVTLDNTTKVNVGNNFVVGNQGTPYETGVRAGQRSVHVTTDGQYMQATAVQSSAGGTGNRMYYGQLDANGALLTPSTYTSTAGSSGVNVNGYSTLNALALLLFAKGSNGVSFNGNAGLLLMSADGGDTMANIVPAAFPGNRCAYAEYMLP
jgi:hypothetical protein